MILETAYLASGCYWSKEYFFGQLEGVRETEVGFMGGHTENPTYRQVCTKTTGHAETVRVVFDPEKLAFEALLRLFFNLHDPTIDRRGKGGQYRSAIFYTSESQRAVAEKLMDELRSRELTLFTELEKAGAFWPAEDRHQGYCKARDIVPCRKAKTLFEERKAYRPTT
jgi:methionine-S-sulfoxide reductase